MHEGVKQLFCMSVCWHKIRDLVESLHLIDAYASYVKTVFYRLQIV